jgi:phosphotransferase system HPr-like phosphotransfer protein
VGGNVSQTLLITSNTLNVAGTTSTATLTGSSPALTAQTITLTAPTTPVTYGASAVTLSATGGASGNAVTFTIDGSSTAGACSVSGTMLTYTGAGNCIVDANQAGNGTYSAAPQVQNTVVINQASQTITFTQPTTPVTYGVSIVTLSATGGSSGNAVTFTIDGTSTSGACSVSGATLTFTGAGNCIIDANQTGNTNYAAATQVQKTVLVNQATQTITFTQPTTPVAYSADLTIPLSATGGASGNAVTFSIDGASTGTGSISGSTLTVTTVGTFVIDANQTSSTNYVAATQVQKTVVVNQATQSITGFAPVSPYTYGSGTITLSSTGGASGNSVVYSIDSSSTATGSINGSTLTVTGVGGGTLVIDANQTGNTNYSAATQVQAIITVNKASQTIAGFAPPSTYTYGSGTITLSSTGGASGNSVTYSIDGSSTATGTISGSTLTVIGVGGGTLVIDANQAGNSNYTAATQVQASITVSKTSQTPVYTGPTSVTVAGGPYTLTATSGASGNSVVFSVVSGPGTITGSTLNVTGVGTIQIALNQAGNGNYLAATQVTANIVVSQSSSSTSLSASLTSVVPGQPDVLTATVSGSGGVKSTGTVTFTATSTGATQGVLGVVTLVNGVATYNGLVWGGTDSITAIYSGDSNYGGSTSNAVTVSNFPISGLTLNWPFINWAQGVSYGANSGAWPVTLQNLTGATVTPTINIANSDFVISGSNCGTLIQGATCTFNVTFTPTSANGGSASGTKITSELTATAGASTTSINVTGIALSSSLTFNWPFLNFTPTVSVGATSSPWPVTMTNASGTSTTVNSISFSDASFAVTSDTCTGQTLGAFATCTFGVTFSPIAADIQQAGTNVISGVTMTATGNSGAVVGTLTAGGWAAAALGFNWPFVTFQNQPIGSMGTNLWLVTVTNYSGSTVSGLTYSFIGQTNYQSGAFTLTNTCSSLAPGASCTFDIAPSPVSGQSAGAYSAQLVVSGSGFSSPALSVSGSATEGGYSINWNQDQQGGTSTIDFGPQNTKNVTAGPWPITVYNNTGSTNTLTITPSLGVFTYDSSTCTNVASGVSCSFNLYFTPTADQYYNGTLTVSDGSNSYTFNTWGGANK